MQAECRIGILQEVEFPRDRGCDLDPDISMLVAADAISEGRDAIDDIKANSLTGAFSEDETIGVALDKRDGQIRRETSASCRVTRIRGENGLTP